MPTQHRQQMIESGHAAPHHGHQKSAVRKAALLAAADEAKIHEAEQAAAESAKAADANYAARRAKRAQRHAAELADLAANRKK